MDNMKRNTDGHTVIERQPDIETEFVMCCLRIVEVSCHSPQRDSVFKMALSLMTCLSITETMQYHVGLACCFSSRLPLHAEIMACLLDLPMRILDLVVITSTLAQASSTQHLFSRNTLRSPRRTLPRTQSLALLHLPLRNRLLRLRQDQFNVARIRHVGINAAVGAVRAATLLRSLVDLDVLDDQLGGVEALCVGVGFGVLEQADEELGGFDGPAGFRDAELFACGNRFVRN